jgi:LacI family transcriptional regulator
MSGNARSNPPKHREISRQLLADIAGGKYAPGERMPSEAQLVERFGVSRPTIIRALRDLQGEGLIERRPGSGTYLKDAGAKPTTSSRQLGLLVPERGTTEIFDLICGELSSLARAQDFALIFGGSLLPHQEVDLSAEHALAMCDQFASQQVQGVFFAPFESLPNRDEVNRQIVERLGRAGIPVVLLDRDLLPFPQRSEFDLVGIDNFAGGYLLVEHLLKLGARRLAFIARPISVPTVEARIAGAREALLRNGQTVSSGWIQLGQPDDPVFAQTVMAGGSWDAVLCANDLIAAHFLRTLEKIGKRVPQDLRLVGFDDAKYASLLGAALTTIHQPCRDIALVAFRALQERIKEPTLPIRSLRLPPRLVIRESCGSYSH